jgi:hypothetical protein
MQLSYVFEKKKLSIARPKLDFPTFLGDEPFNWLRQCEKYFSLTNVPMESWVSLATLHCNGITQTWWRSLRAPSSYVHWTQFCNMVSNRFSAQLLSQLKPSEMLNGRDDVDQVLRHLTTRIEMK